MELAVISIETAAEFVGENYSILKCSQITMWQYGKPGEGFTIEFYGFDTYAKPMIQRMLTDVFGSWEIWEINFNTKNFLTKFFKKLLTNAKRRCIIRNIRQGRRKKLFSFDVLAFLF